MPLRVSFVLAALGGLVACAPQVPDSARGVGFNSVESIQQRDAALEGNGVVVPVTVYPPASGTGAQPPLSGVAPFPGSAEATAAETTRVLAETNPNGLVVSTLPQSSTVGVTNTIGISNENNFDAVSEQRSIEGDAARLAQSRAQYEVIAPTALPERSGGEQPNIVAFALETNHPVGTSVYARAGFNGAAKAERNCAKYPSPDQAQIEFLSSGGPKRDRRGLDPDGDGYACSWDPSPFRKAGSG